MENGPPISPSAVDEDAALRTILEGTASETGADFFAALVKNLSKALHAHGAWVTTWHGEKRLRAVAFWLGDRLVPDYEYDLAGTPCEPVFRECRLVHITDRVLDLYPADPDLRSVGAVSYMGVPLLDIDGEALGHLAVLDTKPMPEQPRALAVFRIFAARAAAELRRLRAEAQVGEREMRLRGLVTGAMDAILDLDRDLKITLLNPAAEKVFRCSSSEVIGQEFARFLTAESFEKLAGFIENLDLRPEGQRSLWIPGGLTAMCIGGEEFPAEATLSRYEVQNRVFYTLILRNVNERLQAERKIRSLTAEAEYLREELKTVQNFDEILGRSEPLRCVLADIEQVAPTDATVLILGETGTGKELVARAIHNRSPRRGKPLIKVNCGAIPTNLIESELFGHEAGAFTGATKRRDGRFMLADGGTIFLDEIGDLPLDLQVKLLRVLQEGEFEPVGSSQTKKIDVRVLAATNRNPHQAVQEGKFREDLYYRLNVFPIEVPPLRERSGDIGLLASTFAEKFARRMGRTFEPLTDECIRRLKAYSWPGNVRELQNVIERAVIVSRDRRLDLDRALPVQTRSLPIEDATAPPGAPKPIIKAHELEQLERENLLAALESTAWRVSGRGGAAELLGMKPSTLSSRMKALGISRPR